MKFYIPALVLLLAPALVTGHDAPCSIDDAIKSIVSQYYKNMELDCVFVTERSSLCTCPAGYIATACSCGSACGSWDIRSSNVCHCQCANMDWTGARCCRMKPQ
ncbi:resistin-like [Engystomops pustulosus]|uniref:resistin-like n=1 Tax=Engystomops pustulosus TaxID=76066 RepID=UPI003AFB2170